MTTEEKQRLERIEKKLDIVIDRFNLDGKGRESPKDLEAWAKDAVSKYRKRKKLKSSPEMGKVLPLSGRGTEKDEREKSQGA